MVILGLLILAAAAALGVETVLATRGTDVTFTMWGETLTASVAVWFLLGAVLMTVAVFGLFLITGAVQRRRGHRVAARHRIQEERTGERLSAADETVAGLAEENERLRNELAAERRAAATMGGVAVPPGAGNVTYGDQVGDAVRSTTISDTGRYEPYPTEPAPAATPVQSEEKAGVLGRFRGEG